MTKENTNPDPFVQILRDERIQRKISTPELAAALDTPASTINNYEVAKENSAPPRINLMRDWAALLDYELVLRKVEKPTRGRRKMVSSTDADDISEDLVPVYLSKYQAALAMGMLIAQASVSQEKSPTMSADLSVIADILARSIH